MSILINDLDLKHDLNTNETLLVRGGAALATGFTSSIGRDSISLTSTFAESSPDSAAAGALASTETNPGGFGVAVAIAVAVTTPQLQDIFPAYLA